MPAPQVSELVPRTYTPWAQRAAEAVARRLVYVVITASIAVPIWLATRSHLDSRVDTVPLDTCLLYTSSGKVEVDSNACFSIRHFPRGRKT